MDEEMPRVQLGLLLQHFSELDDEREPWRVMYPLREVLLLVTCATIASCDDFDDIVRWGEHHLDFLRRYGKLSLDDDVRKYLPKLHDFGKVITIRQLLYPRAACGTNGSCRAKNPNRVDNATKLPMLAE
jgi:hypothetical protein